MDTRLDVEIFLLGDMKHEFLNYLSEIFKSDFVESLSWGHFRRFQLTISEKSTWININFIMLKNDRNLDILLHTFKIFEKKNLVLLLYNANDHKKERSNIESIIDDFTTQKMLIYDGILNEETIKKNSDKIKTSYKLLNCNTDNLKGKEKPNETSKLDSTKDYKQVDNPNDQFNSDLLNYNAEKLKSTLKYLDSNSNNLLIKVGFYPNTMNKKTKMIKKNETNNAYSIEDEIFEIKLDNENVSNSDGEDYILDFSNLFASLLKKHFDVFQIKGNKSKAFLKLLRNLNASTNKSTDTEEETYVESESNDSGSSNAKVEVSKKKYKRLVFSNFIDMVVKSIDWIIVFYISYTLYKFLNEYNS